MAKVDFTTIQYIPKDSNAGEVGKRILIGQNSYDMTHANGVTLILEVHSGTTKQVDASNKDFGNNPAVSTTYDLRLDFRVDREDLVFGQLEDPCNTATIGSEPFKFHAGDKFHLLLIGSDDIRNDKPTNHFYLLEDSAKDYKVNLKIMGDGTLRLRYGTVTRS